ncbi:MAG: hypothetical protein A3H96_00525 [Acidobacteria bacterium RIFCSPLOWO2_02_FULL_67_36]|nr:MAG: hypothetical protein A3H96_00525 [Acidobacteria bacterium RIFCSPLOWO2_02_FULL_67_36]
METDPVLRAAIIGCGQIAGACDEWTGPDEIYTHAKAYQLQRATNLVAVADVDERRARAFSARWGHPAPYADVSRMLAVEAPDIVSICTPDETHLAILDLCLDARGLKAVWCEKPLATEADAAEALVVEYERRGIVLAVNYQRRWDALVGRVKAALERGELGTVQKVVVYYSKGIAHNGSHALDLLLDWFGPSSNVQVLGSHLDFTADDPTVDALLRFGNVPVYLIGLDERAYGIFELHLLGTRGRMSLTAFGREMQWHVPQPDPRAPASQELGPPASVTHDNHQRPALAAALEDIIAAIHCGQQVRSSGRSALATLKICRHLALQAAEGRIPTTSR